MKEEIVNKHVLVSKYFEYMSKHVSDVVIGKVQKFLEINEIASELCVSHKHLTDVIQQATGHHPCYFYDQRIIEEAKQMLLVTPDSIVEIAKRLTYDPSNFSKFFKKMTGQTPGQFRKLHIKVRD
ncbi:MAG: helix-turn-helix domain-containing protein [Flavobacteriaceae bacterium]|jgi:AraC-like DNA-binding protein|nr:helix-turn-helix domain-containing protein [Flavobacteriaceae bacterium]